MNNNINKIFTSAVCICAISFLGGCVGDLLEPKKDETQFYMMRQPKAVEAVNIEKKMAVNLLPMTTPAYMSRNQIVSLAGDGKTHLSEFSRWAESAHNGFMRVMVENLSAISPNLSVYAYPSYVADGLNLRVFVYDCIGIIGENVTMKGRWQIDTIADKKHLAKDFSITVKCGDSYEDYVNAINEANHKLAKDIAEGFLNFTK